MSAESYPDELRYHPEHDWAQIEGDTATLGITWYGQDALGELVHYEPPDAGATISKDGAYGEVESVKAVSDLIAPLSGEVLEVNQKVVDEPETVNADPYGEGWLVRIRVSDPAEADALMDAAAYKAHLESCESSLAHRRRPRGDAGGDRRLIGRGALPRHPGGGAVPGTARPRARALRAGARRAPRGARLAQRPHGLGALVPRRGDLRPLRAGGLRRGAPARGVPDRLHAVPARDEPGRAPDDLRVPDRDLRADGHGRHERLRIRRDDGRRRRVLHREARDRTLEDRARRGGQPAGAAGREDLRAGLRSGDRRGTAPGRHDRPRRGGCRCAGRCRRDLPAAQLLRLPRGGARPRRRRERRAGASDRARRSGLARRPRGARQLRLRDRNRRRAGRGQLPVVRRPALRLHRRARRLHPTDAGTDRRRDDRHRGQAGLCPHPPDPRAAHSPREGHIEHHDEPDAARARRPRPPGVARPAGAQRGGGDLHGALSVREGTPDGCGAGAAVSRQGNVQGVCGPGRTERPRGDQRRAGAGSPPGLRARPRLRGHGRRAARRRDREANDRGHRPPRTGPS